MEIKKVDKIKQIFSDSIKLKGDILNDNSLMNQIHSIVQLLTASLESEKRIYLAGNGGSAADAQHLAAEFTGRFYIDRRAFPVEALHCNTSYMTAVANDYSYDVIYSRLVEGTMNKGDILWLFSTSGNSINIINAAKSALKKDIKVISFTGLGGGALKHFSDITIEIPSKITPRIQECHMLIGHIICELTEQNLVK